MGPATLVIPSRLYLAGYVAALERGWSPDTARVAERAREQLREIAADATAFLAARDDPQALGGPFTLPDGSQVSRLPGFTRWIWDGTFCGAISLRWQKGSNALPPHVLGHIGYSVVPWKQGRGYAKLALAGLLPLARQAGLAWVDLTTNPDNLASQRVILACGGSFVERFTKPAAFGGVEALRFRIELAPSADGKAAG